MWFSFHRGGSYLHKHDHTFAQDFTDGCFVIVVALEGLLFQELACGQVEGFTGPVEPASVEPLLTFMQKEKVMVILAVKLQKQN